MVHPLLSGSTETNPSQSIPAYETVKAEQQEGYIGRIGKAIELLSNLWVLIEIRYWTDFELV